MNLRNESMVVNLFILNPTYYYSLTYLLIIELYIKEKE